MTGTALDMGRYAAFVWPAYAISAAGFAWMIGDTLLRAARARREADRREADRSNPATKDPMEQP